MAKSDAAATDTTVPTASDQGSVIVGRAVKIAGETITPGASLILDGNLRLGILHVIGAGLLTGLVGPIGSVLLAANSYSKSVSGKSLPEQVLPNLANRS